VKSNLTRIQIKSLCRLGDIYIPGDESLPSFTELGCVEHYAKILDYMDNSDLIGIYLLLWAFSIMPNKLLRGLVNMIENSQASKSSGASVLRLLRVALRGLIFTLYYSGYSGQGNNKTAPFEVLGFEVSVYVDDLKS